MAIDDMLADVSPYLQDNALDCDCDALTLMIVAAVSRGLAIYARRAGYAALLLLLLLLLAAAVIPPCMLYRRVCAVLQGQRAADRRGRWRLPSGMTAVPCARGKRVMASKSAPH